MNISSNTELVKEERESEVGTEKILERERERSTEFEFAFFFSFVVCFFFFLPLYIYILRECFIGL